MVRFVHASDLHLDATFGGVDATDEKVAGALARSTIEALDRVVELCIERGADFLVIAGDLYNRADRSLRAELAFQRAMRRLDSAGIGAFVVHGNHDPADGWSAGLELPESVIVFSAEKVERREFLRDGQVVCAVYGRSFPTRQVRENLAREFARDDGDALAVAVLHANVGQREGWDDYAPCTVDDLRAAGMDYWALGHIHLPGRVSDQPPALYPGSTQGLDPTEEGPRGCYVVELDTNGAVEEFVETASVLWRRLTVDAVELGDLDRLRNAVTEACEAVRSEGGCRPTVVRIELTGRSEVHADLARPGVLADLVTDLREDQLGREPWIWVDRIRDHTRPEVDLDQILEEEGLRGDLVRLAAARGSDPEAAAELVESLLAPVLAQLTVRPDLEASPEHVIERARDLCLDLLSGDGS
jgi:DNA repair exonuclease SbcCD nuclease subunit